MKSLHEIKEKSPLEFKNDDGVRLVDKFSLLKEQKDKIEEEIESVREGLIQFSKQKEINTIFGTEKKVSIRSFEILSLPPKEEREALQKLLREESLWDAFSEVDTHKLSKAIKEDSLPTNVQDKIMPFVTLKEGYRVSISKGKEE